MSYFLKIEIDALNDIKETIAWYEMQLKGLGQRYKNQVLKEINSLKTNPNLFSIKYSEIRCLKIYRFPFLIHYIVDEDLKTVTVLAVIHTSRNPEIWKKKK